jgi:hypothetical protein
MDPKTGMAKFYAGNEAAPGEAPNPNGIPGFPRQQWGRVNEREVDPNQFDFRGRSAIDQAEGNRARQAANLPQHPHSTGGAPSTAPHIGDMSMFQGTPKIHVNVNNQAGATVQTSIAQMGMNSGSYAA